MAIHAIHQAAPSAQPRMCAQLLFQFQRLDDFVRLSHVTTFSRLQETQED